MIRQIGVSDYGLYSLVITFIAYFVLDFGMSGTVTRFLAKLRAEGEHQKIENLMGLILKVYLSIDALIFLVLLIIYFFLANIFHGLTPQEIQKLRGLYAIAALFSVLNFTLKPMHGAMMAFEFFVETKVIDMLQKVGTVLMIVIALALGMGVFALVLINGAVAFTTSLLLFIVFTRKSKIKMNLHYYDRVEMKALLSFSFWVFLISMAQRFRLTFMPSILGMFSNSTQISIFSLGMSIEGIVYIISSALNGLFLPKVTRLSHQRNSEAITKLMIKVGRIQLYIVSILLMGFCIYGQDFIRLWVGEDFHNTYFVVILLTGTNIVTLTQHIASDVVFAENKVRYTATITFITSAIALLCSIILAPSFGAVGCAISFFFAMSLFLFLLNKFYEKKLHIDIKTFFKNCHLKILPTILIISIVFYGIKHFFPINSWISFISFGAIYTCFIIIVDYFFLFNEDEKKLVTPLLLKIKYFKNNKLRP